MATTSSNTAPSSVTATATAADRLNLATPYEPPRSCESSWSQTSLIWTRDGSTTVPVLVSDPVASCYPSGWDDTQAKNRFSFRPAVCPSGWIYWDMARTTDSSQIVSTAYCCESGYAFSDYLEGPQLASTLVPNQCGRWTKTIAGEADDEEDNINPPDGTLMVHQAWAITWASSDRAHLSPEPPMLTSGELYPTWQPPMSAAATRYARADGEGEGDRNDGWVPLLWFLMVGLPVIVVALLLSAWLYGRRRRRRQAAAMTPQAGTGDTSTGPNSQMGQ